LNKITHKDKLWVVLRLIDNDIKAIFTLDCVFAVYSTYSTFYAADIAVYATDVIAYSDHPAFYKNATAAAYSAEAAAYYSTLNKKEEHRQIKSLIYLIEGKL
jgi:hypothetical protein